jgi:hypothetical protein
VRAKIFQDLIATNDWVWWYVPIIPARRRSTNRGIVVHAGPSKRSFPISKIAAQKGLVAWLNW